MKVKIQVIVSFMLVLSLFGSPNAKSAQTWTPGVGSGDYFTYEMYGIYTSNSPNVEIAIPEFERNTTLWARINITSVLGSIIYQVYTLHYSVGSKSSDFQTDVNPQNQALSELRIKVFRYVQLIKRRRPSTNRRTTP
jgi:hypothetical protein